MNPDDKKQANMNDSVSTTPTVTSNFNSVNFNDLDGVPEGIPEKQPEHQNIDHPYMGNLTSHEIGMMAKYGMLSESEVHGEEF